MGKCKEYNIKTNSKTAVMHCLPLPLLLHVPCHCHSSSRQESPLFGFPPKQVDRPDYHQEPPTVLTPHPAVSQLDSIPAHSWHMIPQASQKRRTFHDRLPCLPLFAYQPPYNQQT
uniref:Uncharacterized protein n=1 Tax=Lygus hesperus TaxID=30085 RepID=A0A146ME13_LYGHE